MSRLFMALGVAAMVGACGVGADASIIPFEGILEERTDGLGNFSGSMEYDSLFQRLTVTLTNTSSAANGGFLTGIAFNIATSGDTPGVTLVSSTHAFTITGATDAPPWGRYDAGAAVNGSWLGAGSPNLGIGAGQTGTFVFQVLASEAASLTTADFLSSRNGAPALAVRARGFDDEGSDKIPGRPVPGPGVLPALALGGMLAMRRRR